MDQCTLGAVCRRPEKRGLRAQTKILPLERVPFQRNFKKIYLRFAKIRPDAPRIRPALGLNSA
jgi:hypothetical protein